jgi:Flp pilus assembly protein TadG
VEFALVALPFLTLVLGVMELGFDLYVQTMLDYALETAARGVQVGSTVGNVKQNNASFRKDAICPYLYGLDCTSLAVAVTMVPKDSNYFTFAAPPTITNATNAVGCVNTGTAGQIMLAEAWYVGPTFLGALIPNFSVPNSFGLGYTGSLAHVTFSSAGFVNEAFAGGQTNANPCG